MILHLLRMRRNVNRNVFNDRKKVSATASQRTRQHLRRRRIFAKSVGVAKKVARGQGFTSGFSTTSSVIVCAVVKSCFFCKQI